MDGKTFAEEFLKIFDKNSGSYKSACDWYCSKKNYTDFITKEIEHILEEKGNYKEKEHGKEFYRIDISAWKSVGGNKENFDINGINLINHVWEYEVAVEHENDSPDWMYEVTKLLTINCPLRVVIGYIPFDKRDKDVDCLGMVFEKISTLKVFEKNDFANDEFVVILGNSSCNRVEDYFNYKAYRLTKDGFEKMRI